MTKKDLKKSNDRLEKLAAFLEQIPVHRQVETTVTFDPAYFLISEEEGACLLDVRTPKAAAKGVRRFIKNRSIPQENNSDGNINQE